MITKFLLTALIIIAAVMYLRHRSTQGGASVRPQPPAPPAWYWRLLPAGLLLAALLVSAGMFWVQWQDEHRIYVARVIDTRTGEVSTYSVYRDAVHGRSFETIDGRSITLADVERLEVVDTP